MSLYAPLSIDSQSSDRVCEMERVVSSDHARTVSFC